MWIYALFVPTSYITFMFIIHCVNAVGYNSNQEFLEAVPPQMEHTESTSDLNSPPFFFFCCDCT